MKFKSRIVTMVSVTALCVCHAADGNWLQAEIDKVAASGGGKYPDNYMFGRASLPAWGIYFRHCDNIALDRVSLRLKPGAKDARPPIVKDDANVSLKMDIGTSPR